MQKLKNWQVLLYQQLTATEKLGRVGKNWQPVISLKNEMIRGLVEKADNMSDLAEIPFWLFGQLKWVSGINKNTSCQEVINYLFIYYLFFHVLFPIFFLLIFSLCVLFLPVFVETWIWFCSVVFELLVFIVEQCQLFWN